MRGAVYASIMAIGLMAPSGAFADSNYKAADIVKHFAAAADLGASRGVCIGTKDKCEEKAAQAAPAGFDMLISFGLDSAELDEQARANLNEFAKALKNDQLRAANFIVEGYTDARGGSDYNELLSQRRAQSVAAFLLANGVESTRVEAIGKGELSPRVADPYDPVNRRVEMRIKMQ